MHHAAACHIHTKILSKKIQKLKIAFQLLIVLYYSTAGFGNIRLVISFVLLMTTTSIKMNSVKNTCKHGHYCLTSALF